MPLLLALLALIEPARTTFYDGPGHSDDRVTGLLADAAGNCYLAGYSYGDTSDYDFCVVKVDSSGDTLWTRRYGSPLACEDRIWCSAFDNAGDIVVCGGSIVDFAQGWDFLVATYRPDGTLSWLKRLDFPGHGDDKPVGLAIAPDNAVIITGSVKHGPDSTGRRQDWDIATVRLSPGGDTIWTRRFGGRAGLDDLAVGLACDSSGNCYVVGKTVNTAPATDIVLLKYSPDGRLLWERSIDGPAGGSDFPTGILLDRRQRPLVYGTVTGKGTGFDYLLARYSPAGELLWQRTYDAGGRVDIAQAAGLTASGDVVVTGQSTAGASSIDIATLCYSSSGLRRWVARYNGPQGRADRGYCVAGDDSGRVFVGGSSDGITGHPDLLVIGYSSLGDTLWTCRWSGGGIGESRPVVLLPRPDGLLVAGYGHRGATGFDYLLFNLREPGR